MAKAKLSSAQITTMLSLRNLDSDTATTIRTSMFTSIKDSFGIPPEHKVQVELDDEDSSVYGVIIRKKTGDDYNLGADGKWDQGVPQPAPVAQDTAQSSDNPSGKRVIDTRWFKVDRTLISHAVIHSGVKFSTGSTDIPIGFTLPSANDADSRLPMVMGTDGALHIQLDMVEDNSDDMGGSIIDLLSRIIARTN